MKQVGPQLKNFTNLKFVKSYGGVLAALIALMVLFSFLSPHFLQTNNILTVLAQVSIIAILAYGMTFVLMIGEIDLSVGAIVALCGIVLGVMLSSGQGAVVSIIIVLLVGALAGLFNGFISAKFRIPTFIVTVATMGIFRGVGYAITDARPIQIEDPIILFLGNAKLFDVIPVPVVIVVMLLIVAHVLLSKTKFGRQAKIVGGNKVAAEYVGINVRTLQMKIFMITGIAAAISSILLTARLYSAQPNAAGGYELDAIAAAVLGGTSLSGGYGTVIGTFIGALIMGVINNGMNLVGMPYFYQQIVKGLIIIVAVYIDVRNKERMLSK
ncbi:ABC transporter permease [Desulforamulus aquiferis]|uniref:ABC transporter permease n=1 Tax=Desulforamulus aquiferis TaxID=1397668 RepID=A0AAW7ZC56_9FIRM|nr:ABC transporter permease [Desulforamulus aquiferis]